MKKVWLFLAFAAVAAATTTEGQDQTPMEARRWPCYGCYSPFGHQIYPVEVPLRVNFSDLMTVQDKQPQLPEERPVILKEPRDFAREPFKLADVLAARRSKREERRGGLMPRRRGRPRSGSRPVCRGCYSGLMIVGPPVHTANNTLGPVMASHSESGADSSGEDGPLVI